MSAPSLSNPMPLPALMRPEASFCQLGSPVNGLMPAGVDVVMRPMRYALTRPDGATIAVAISISHVFPLTVWETENCRHDPRARVRMSPEYPPAVTVPDIAGAAWLYTV